MPSFLADKGLRILRNGFNVIPIKPGNKAPSIKNWRGSPTTEADVKRWMSNGRASHGVGITTDTTPLVDIDVFDTAMNRAMVDYIETHIGFAPVRVGFAPKRGMLFRSVTPFRKITSKEFVDPAGKKAQVEILGEGEQFVAFHIHPDTHQPYHWLGRENPELTQASKLPVLTQEQGRAITTEFERLATEAGWRLKRSQLPALTDADDPFSIVSTPLGLSDDELRDAVMLIPNEGVDYDTWIEVGMAIHHETGASDFGHDLFYEWSDQSLKHDDTKFEKSWNSIGKYDDTRRPVTARLILKMAKEHKQAAIAEQINELVRRMELAADANELKEVSAECRKLDLDILDRSRLIGALQKAVKDKTHMSLGIREAREMVRYKPTENETPEWLNGWCYLKHAKRFYDRTSGEMIEREAFDATFGRFTGSDTTASKYALDTIKIPVFHMTIYLPSDDMTFRDASGLEWINTYRDTTPTLPAELTRRDLRNVERVEQHFRHLFEDEREIEILISTLAYTVQTRKRVNWITILQGAEAIGKTFIAEMMNVVLGGLPHVYKLDTEVLISSPFTDWSGGHQLIFIEELKVFGHRYDVISKLKTRISDDTVTVHPKNISPYNVPNITSYIGLTNYRDAIPIGPSDTRTFSLMSRWQNSVEVAKFKTQNPTYYSNLFTALSESPGAIRKWLLEYRLHSEFNPRNRAPLSHGREVMIEAGKSEEENIIEDLIEDKKHPLVSENLIVVHILRELIADDTGVLVGPLSTGQGLRRVLENMGFTSIKRFRLGTERFRCWSKNPELISAPITTVQKLVSGLLRDDLLGTSDL